MTNFHNQNYNKSYNKYTNNTSFYKDYDLPIGGYVPNYSSNMELPTQISKAISTPSDLPKLVIRTEEKFNLFIPKVVLDKIKYLCRSFPSQEWSGVLFWEAEGDVKDIKNLKITAKDIYPLDLGNSVHTEFEYDKEIVGYMARHPELMDCHQSLVHSHNHMSAFFSGEDTRTLQEQTPYYKNFLSLIVNNAGNYVVGLAILLEAELEHQIKKKLTYTNLNNESGIFGEKEESKSGKETSILVYYGNIEKENEVIEDSEFEAIVSDLSSNKAKQSTYKSNLPVKDYTITKEEFEKHQIRDAETYHKADISISAKDFILKIASQDLFRVMDIKASFQANLDRAIARIPAGMEINEYSSLTFDFIEPVLTYMNVLQGDEEEYKLFKDAVALLEENKNGKYYAPLYESIKDWYLQVEEEMLENELSIHTS